MGNKVKYNLKNVHAAKMTETVTDGVASFTYAKPKAIPGAVSISLDAEGESSPFYADGIVYFVLSPTTGTAATWRLPLSLSGSEQRFCRKRWMTKVCLWKTAAWVKA